MTAPTVASSTYTEGAPQVDGRRWVKEVHTDSDGNRYEYEWLGAQSAEAVIADRVAILNAQLAERAAAMAVVAGTKLPMTKLKFRELFTTQERMGIDALHAQFEVHGGLTALQKAAIRTGLEDYKMAENIVRPFDARVAGMLDMYVALGLLTAERKTAIIEAGNG